MLESDYYLRQTILKEVGSTGQQKLKETKVLIVGAGGLGHPVSTYLAAAGVGKISILDFDKIESSNLNRQILFTPEDISQYKANVLCDRIKKQNPFIDIESIVDRMNVYNAEKIALQFDLIIDCCDNFATKFLLHDTCWLLGKRLVQASIYQYEGQVQVFDYSDRKQEKACLRCLWPETPKAGCVGNCSEAGVLGAVAGTLGTIQAMEAIKLVLGLGECQTGVTTIVDLLTLKTSKLIWNKNKSCPLCCEQPKISDLLESNYNTKDSFEVRHLDIDNAIYIDIRELDEDGHDDICQKFGILKKPLSEIESWKDTLEAYWKNNQTVVFVCTKGIRSRKLAQKLNFERGRDDCLSLYDGLEGLNG